MNETTQSFNDVKLDSNISVIVDDKYMWAKVLVSKPQNGGTPATLDDVRRALTKNGVFAHIDFKAIEDYLSDIPDGKSVIAAKGIPPVDGVSGRIDYAYEPTSQLKPTIDEETGIVNFKELGRVRNIKKGSLIASIRLATEGTPGSDIRGTEIKPMPGASPKYVLGTGTVLSNDQTKIFAANDGNLRWDKDRFVVDTVVTIGGNVDAAVGNIDFVGDVIIKGGIDEGYKVKGKNVTVKGNVTNATVMALEHLDLVGSVHSYLVSDGDIKMNFAENCNINCKGQLQAKSMVNCNVTCEGEINVTGTKGVIIGGEIICYQNITASQIGSEGYSKTNINLGNTMVVMNSHKDMLDNFNTLSENYKKLKTLYEKLNELKKIQPLTPEQEDARKQSFLFIMNERKVLEDMSAKIEKSENTLARSRQLQLIVKSKCYPGVSVKLYTSLYTNNREMGPCTFYLDSNNEIQIRNSAK